MRAVVLRETKITGEPDERRAVLAVEDRPIPVPLPGEVLVRVTKAGLCETDLQLVKGYMGFHGVLGHEFVGIAESGNHQGSRVVGEINCSCHQCDVCRSGLPTHCPHRTVLGILGHDGAFAEYVAVPERNLHRVPDSVPDHHAVFTEPLAAAFQILEQVVIHAGQRVIVLGDGRLGNLCAQVLAMTGCRLTVVGKHARKLKLLRRLGLETALIHELNEPNCADVVVDCTGSATGLETAIRLLKPRGTLVLKTTVAGSHSLPLASLVIDELTLIGSRCGPFAAALRALSEGRVQVEPLIDATYPLNEALQAFERATTTPTLKLLLQP